MNQKPARSDFLILSRGQWDADKTPEQIQDAIDRFYAWYDRAVAEGHIKPGRRLAKASSLVTRAGVTDGPFTEAKEIVGGYWFIVASSLEQACAFAAENPCLGCGLVYEVRPVEEARASVYVPSNEMPAHRLVARTREGR